MDRTFLIAVNAVLLVIAVAVSPLSNPAGSPLGFFAVSFQDASGQGVLGTGMTFDELVFPVTVAVVVFVVVLVIGLLIYFFVLKKKKGFVPVQMQQQSLGQSSPLNRQSMREPEISQSPTDFEPSGTVKNDFKNPVLPQKNFVKNPSGPVDLDFSAEKSPVQAERKSIYSSKTDSDFSLEPKTFSKKEENRGSDVGFLKPKPVPKFFSQKNSVAQKNFSQKSMQPEMSFPEEKSLETKKPSLEEGFSSEEKNFFKKTPVSVKKPVFVQKPVFGEEPPEFSKPVVQKPLTQQSAVVGGMSAKKEPPLRVLSIEEEQDVKNLVEVLSPEKLKYSRDEIMQVILEKGYEKIVANEVLKRLGK